MIRDRKHILIRGYVAGLALILFALAIVFQLVGLQLNASPELRKFAGKTNFRKNFIKAKRGNLYASDGSLLAISVDKYDVHLDMVTVKKKVFEKDLASLSDSLSALLGRSSKYYRKTLKSARENNNQYLRLARGLGYYDMQRLKTFPILKLGQIRGGLIVQSKTQRVFPSEKVGSRTIGYDDKRGRAGLEGAYSDFLKGEDGEQMEKRINGNNWKPIDVWQTQKPVDGSDVYTTIDIDLQEMAYEELESQLRDYDAENGTAILMEVNTGEIKAMVNLAKNRRGNYVDNRNFAVWEASEPGSSIKTAVVMAAIEQGYVNSSSVFDTEEGEFKIYGKTIRDSHPIGEATIQEIIEQSSNVGVAKLALKYYEGKPEKLFKQWKKWKLDRPLGIQIPGETEPYIPNTDTETWSKISLPWISFGYETKFTPLQILTFYNGIANNGQMLKPLFIKKIEKSGKTLETFSPEVRVKKMASPETIGQIQEILKGVVENGTAKKIKWEACSFAGKTSTTQVDYGKGDGSKQYRASFVGYFPADKPMYSCMVTVHKPNRKKGYYGGVVAAPVFREIAKNIYLQKAIKPEKIFAHRKSHPIEINQIEPLHSLENIPDLVGSRGWEAIAKLENLEMEVDYQGVGIVKSQSLAAGTPIERGRKIYLELER